MMLTTVPFSGFYGSIHESNLDYALEQLFQDENGNPNEALGARFHELMDWKHVEIEYAKYYVDSFATRFEVKLKWESMTSPREYNFETDRLFAYISLKEVRRLRAKVVNEKDFRDACRESFTSRSGFISSYSNNPDDWGGMQTWDHNQVGTLLQALADQESNSNRHHDRDDGFDVNAELELVADIDGESDLSGWLWESAPDSEEKSRIDKVYSYLREREARKWVWRDGNVYRRDAHA